MDTELAQAAALRHLAGELLGAITPSAVGRLTVTTAAELLGADAATVFSRSDDHVLTAIHSTGWPADLTRRYERVVLDDVVAFQRERLRDDVAVLVVEAAP